MHYYNRNLGDYAKKAGRLSMLQHGSYTLLIDACYDREQFPTLDEAIEWTWASSEAEIEAVKFVLRKFFVLEGDRYVQKRIEEEIAAYREKSNNNKRIAQEREAKRKETFTKRSRNVHETSQKENEAPPNQEPITNNHKPISKTLSAEPSASSAPSIGSLAFEAYASAYRTRYACDPVRNAKVNSIFKNLAKQLGEAAPEVATWYVTSETMTTYTKSSHDPALLLRDAAGLHTRWKNSSPMSTKTAMAADNAVGDMDMVRRVAKRFGEVPALPGASVVALEQKVPLI